MTYYFNTLEQISGDNAHPEPDSSDVVHLSKRPRQENSTDMAIEGLTGQQSVMTTAVHEKDRSTVSSVSCFKKSSSSAMTFFANPVVVSQVPSLVLPSHNKAFIETLNGLAMAYQAPNFLANVLSVIGDFYYNKPSLPFKNLPLIAYELYETVLLINKTHRVAQAKMYNIYHSDRGAKRMIDDRNRFGMANRYIQSMPQKTAMDIFSQAIDGHVDEIETFLAHDVNRADTVLDSLLEHIVMEIVNNRIAGSKSPHIATQISRKYKQASMPQTDDSSFNHDEDDNSNRPLLHIV